MDDTGQSNPSKTITGIKKKRHADGISKLQNE